MSFREILTKYSLYYRSTFTAAIVKVLFDIDVSDDNDEIMDMVAAALEWPGEVFTPGKYLVEVIPLLKYVPPWFPGANVQRLSIYWRYTIDRLKSEPFNKVKTALVSSLFCL